MERRAFLAAFAVLLLLAAGCGNDGPTAPRTAPMIESVGLPQWTVLTGTVGIPVAAAGADSVVLFVDGVRHTADTERPFMPHYRTGELANGLHRVAVWAVNAAGISDTTFITLTQNVDQGVATVVRPLEATVAFGDTLRFTSWVLGAEDQTVTWRVDLHNLVREGTGPGRAAVPDYPGSIDAGGLYTAPAERSAEQIITVQAVPAAGETYASNQATVNLTPAPVVEILDPPAELVAGRTYAFQVRVRGAADPGVVWSLPAGPGQGSVDADGVYTAPEEPPDPPEITLRAVSAADAGRFDEVSLPIRAEYGITAGAGADTLLTGAGTTVTATVTGAPDPGVLWSVDGGGAYGTVTAQGVYTAPATLPDPPRAVVRATARADTARSTTVTIRLMEGPDPATLAFLDAMVHSGRLLAEVGDQVTGAVGSALLYVAHLTGETGQVTGTLRREGDGFVYESEPSDRFIIQPRSGPAWNVHVHALELDEAALVGWRLPLVGNGYLAFGTLEFEAEVPGLFSLTVSQESHAVEWPFKPAMVCDPPGRFEREVAGWLEIPATGRVDLELLNAGVEDNCGTPNLDDTLSGAATLEDGGRITFDESERLGYWEGDGVYPGENIWDWRFENTGTLGGSTYRLTGAEFRGRLVNTTFTRAGDVANPDEFAVSGRLLRNGAPYAQVRFDRPVEVGNPPPYAVLDFGYGLTRTLRPPTAAYWPPDLYQLVPDPFR